MYFILHSFVVAFKTEREREKGQQMNEYGTMHQARKERRKHVLWIQMKIFATEKLLLVSAAVTFFIFLFEVVIEASRGIRWEKESFCCSFYSRTKTNFHFSIFDSDCQIVIRQKKKCWNLQKQSNATESSTPAQCFLKSNEHGQWWWLSW